MMAYLEEVEKVTTRLERKGCLDQFFEQKLLLAMDEGWGELEFIEAIRDTLLTYYDVSKENTNIKFLRIPKDKGSIYWESQLRQCNDSVKDIKEKGGFSIVVCNLAEHIDNLNSEIFMNMLADFAKDLKAALFIPWIPYGGKAAVLQIESKFSAIMSLRTICIPPISEEEQIKYMSNVLKEKEFQLAADCDEMLKLWIMQTEMEENHKGYSSLENMCDMLIYHKMLKNDDTVITPSDIEGVTGKLTKKSDAYELLGELIGMAQIKGKVKEIVAQIKLQNQLVDMGKKIERPSLHMAFLGNPGTGKTTLARILGKIFIQEKILRKGGFHEHSGNEFLEGNVSEMIRKMRKTCRESYGSILFIDEAYGMAIGHSNGNTGDDLLPILVEEMENHRDDMCVILAGYEDEMEAFFKANSGIKSRIPHILHFPNYNKEELLDIFTLMADGCFEYEEELKETLQDYLESLPDDYYESKEFSNARFIRNLYERVWGKAAYRINFTDDKDIILKNVDIQAALEEDMFNIPKEEKSKRRIGFAIAS